MTDRQREVVSELALGKTNKEIATALRISEGMVKAHLFHLKRKHPHINRYNTVKVLIRDHQRLMACRLNSWIQRWRPELPADALPGIDGILADQVAEVLK